MWNKLKAKEKAEIMKMAFQSGIYDLDTIRDSYNEFAIGGPKDNKRAKYPKNPDMLGTLDPFNILGLKKYSPKIMRKIQYIGDNAETVNGNIDIKNVRSNKEDIANIEAIASNPARDAFLLAGKDQYDYLRDQGYIYNDKDTEAHNYYTVNRAVNAYKDKFNKEVPIWQTAENAIEREKLVPLLNTYENGMADEESNQDLEYGYLKSRGLPDPGSYSGTYYTNPYNGNIYFQGVDFNNYSPADGGDSFAALSYEGNRRKASYLLDAIGNPIVTTTGYQPLYTDTHKDIRDNDGNYIRGEVSERQLNVSDLLNDFYSYKDTNGNKVSKSIGSYIDDLRDTYLEKAAKRGLYPYTYEDGYTEMTLPEVTITPKKKH